MRSIFISITIVICLSSFGQGLPPIGEWREHLPYHSAIDLVKVNGKLYAATPYSVFSVDLDDLEIRRMSRITGLNETGVSALGTDGDQTLLIAYSNSNLDLVRNQDVHNIPGIRQSTVPGNKSIYDIHHRNGSFYLATGLGVIVIDKERREIKETWYLEPGGGQVKVNAITSDASFFYAATESGIYRMPVNAPNPTDPSSWENVDFNLGAGDFSGVAHLESRIFSCRNDSLFSLNGNSWTFFYHDTYSLIDMNVSEGKLLLCERSASLQGRITILNTNGSIFRVINNTAAVSLPRRAILVNNDPWVADQFAGLSHIFPGGQHTGFQLNSPLSIASGEMRIRDGKLIVGSGAVDDSWNYQFNSDGLYVYSNGQWENIHREKFSLLDSLLDFVTVEPGNDGSFWAGSFGGGLLQVKPNNQFEIYKQGFLGETIGDPGSYRVGGLALDKEQHLWISNFGSSEPLRVRKKDGSWKNFAPPFFLFERALSQLIIDDKDFKWIVSPLGNGVVVFDNGNSIDDISDDRWGKLTEGAGNGNLPSAEVWAVVKDKNGFIWVGTSNGIAVYECAVDVFSGCDAVWPVVSEGSFPSYLLQGQQVRSIAIDGANRKWIATANGVFLVSPMGDKLIYRFTENNSPLFSSDVRQVTIDGKTGEVFFATLKGICSFRGTATEGSDKTENPVSIFPNPVPPGYNGTIGFRGLVNNAFVRITELDGRLVYVTRALGGQAVWDGRNYRGQKISSGVYLVLVTDENGKKNASGRIVFLN